MRIVTVVGARPQFIKASVLSRAIRQHNKACRVPAIDELIVHTGQHYDRILSDVFFDELGIPKPAHNLAVKATHHGSMTGRMLEKIEAVLLDTKPDTVLIYGDTNSTLAGALAAVKLHIPVVHVEAGLRSFNRRMPEEINRLVADHVSALLLCPTQVAVDNLRAEGCTENVYNIGDVMYDACLFSGKALAEKDDVLDKLSVDRDNFVLVTFHRAENTDSPERLRGIVDALSVIAAECDVLLPLHPRTRGAINDADLWGALGNTTVIEPVSYFEMLRLQQQARVVITDSGGMQKEAYFLKTPCITMRDETEWVETVEVGWNRIVGADADAIVTAFHDSSNDLEWPLLYGDGKAGEKALDLLLAHV